MYIDYLREYLAVARLSSFSKAAAECSVSQPTISRHITEMEDLVGAPLLKRSTRSVALTDVGRAFTTAA